MPFDLSHFVERLFSPFNPESRFYWPAVYSLALVLLMNIVWYNWRRRDLTPPENILKPWGFWTNILFVILLLVLFIAKVPFVVIAIAIAINIGLLVYMYERWLPPQELAWDRERRKRQYFPQPAKKRRRR